MVTSREEVKEAVQQLLNDVIEQGFQHLVHHPQESNELNQIIHEATSEMNYQLLKLDSHNFKKGSKDLMNYYQGISKDTQRSSLNLLSRLQKVRERDSSPQTGRPKYY